MRRIFAFTVLFLAFGLFADTIVITFNDGTVQKVELKGKVKNVASVKFVSENEKDAETSSKKQFVGKKNAKDKAESQQTEKKQEVSSEKSQKTNQPKDEFAVFEKDMKEKLKPTFEGMWKTNFGTLVLKVKGNKVYGMYKNGEGKITGTLSDDGYTLTGRWSEAPDYLPPKHAGKFIFKLSKSGGSFRGLWGFGDEKPDSEWIGRRIK